jgi:hypothetical protein
MADNFESEKNLKASGYTAVVCAALLIVLLYASWTQPVNPPPVQEEGIEVNLGNSDQGLGNDQPYLPGKPSAEQKEKYTPPKQAVVVKEAQKDVETDDANKEDAPVVKKPPVTKPDATKIPDKEVAKATVKPVKKPEILPTPAPPKPVPKARMGAVQNNGTGGNDADDYKPGGNQGIAGGHGDQGAPGGNPSSTNYAGGGHGSGGISTTGGLKGRRIRSVPSFTDDFNQNATIVLDVHVDENGNVTSAEYALRGSTSSAADLISIAKRRAMQVKFDPGPESFGGLMFNFRVRN